jgi:rhodanese-related sulfurtransferase
VVDGNGICFFGTEIRSEIGAMHKRQIVFFAAALILLAHSVSVPGQEKWPVEKNKQTVLGKYVTAAEAYEMWKANQAGVAIVDCRTPEEYVYVGHAPMALNVPSHFGQWNPATGKMTHTENREFERVVQKKFAASQTLLLMCRSGTRSAASVNRLAALGYKNVYSIIDGFEGDKVSDDDSYFKGKRMKNGWKNSGAPWTYDLDPQLVFTSPKD